MNTIGVFLDRDGTINEEKYFLSNPDELVLIPRSGEAIRELNQLGVKVFVISNQSGIGRGFITEDDVKKVNERLVQLLQEQNARLNKIYYCPHGPDDSCECRKPNIGMLKQAEREFGINLKKSFVIGDRFVDVDAGTNAGATSFLVLTGYGTDSVKESKNSGKAAQFIAANLYDAVQQIKKILLV